MKIQCETCGRTDLIKGMDIEIRDDGTLLINGEEKTCPACGHEEFREIKEVK